MEKIVWVLIGHSGRCRFDFGPSVFSKKPSKKKLKQIALDWDSDEDRDGPGNFGSYVYLELYKVGVDNEELYERENIEE